MNSLDVDMFVTHLKLIAIELQELNKTMEEIRDKMSDVRVEIETD